MALDWLSSVLKFPLPSPFRCRETPIYWLAPSCLVSRSDFSVSADGVMKIALIEAQKSNERRERATGARRLTAGFGVRPCAPAAVEAWGFRDANSDAREGESEQRDGDGRDERAPVYEA